MLFGTFAVSIKLNCVSGAIYVIFTTPINDFFQLYHFFSYFNDIIIIFKYHTLATSSVREETYLKYFFMIMIKVKF